MVHTAIITSPIAAHHNDYPSSHRQIIIVIMIIAMIIMLIQIVIVTIMPMIIGGSIILASVGEVVGDNEGGVGRNRWGHCLSHRFAAPWYCSHFISHCKENLVCSKICF